MPSSASIRAFYDRFGARQDSQAFYEDPAVERLLAAAGLADARTVCEFGCGTGRLAERLLREVLPPDAAYLGIDLSPVMVGLARRRLTPFGPRASVILTDGTITLPGGPASADGLVATYVLDLLEENAIRRFVEEAHRVLRPAGRLCLISLTFGFTPVSRLVSRLWAGVHRLRPTLVGGCRPIRLTDFLPAAQWIVGHREVIAPFGIPSEVLVALKRPPPLSGPAAASGDTG